MNSKIRFNFWPALAFLGVLVIFISNIFFIFNTPLPRSWDEAMYFNRAYYDWCAFQKGGFKKLVGTIHYEEPYRPPGYRISVLPFNLIFGVHPIALKLHEYVSPS